MDKRIINLIIGAVLAMFAIFMINNHLKSREAEIQRLIEEGKLVPVVLAKVDIPRESTIAGDMVYMDNVRAQSVQSGDLTSMASAIGKFTEVDILQGQHINRNMIRPIGGARYLSQAVPQGFRAITISVDKVASIEGLLKPNDSVDIVSTFNIPDPMTGESDVVVVTVFQGVKILATNRNLSQYVVPPGVNTVTLALKPEDVKVLTYILEWSRIRLVLRPPLDTSVEYGYSAVTWESLMKKLGMWQPQTDVPVTETIEVYRATSKEDAPIR